jgi:hypothetical protein
MKFTNSCSTAYDMPNNYFAFYKFIVKYIPEYFHIYMTDEQLNIINRKNIEMQCFDLKCVKFRTATLEERQEKNIYSIYGTLCKKQNELMRKDFRQMYDMNERILATMPFHVTNLYTKLYTKLYTNPVHILSTQVFEHTNVNQIVSLMKDMINGNSQNIKYQLFKYFTPNIYILPDTLMAIIAMYL